MDLSLDFTTYTTYSIYVTIAFFLLTLLGIIFKWGIRFRLVGITGFMGVLTIGLWGLSLGLFAHKTIPGAVPYNLVYDNGANKTVIVLPKTVTESELKATLTQAANNLYSSGRTGIGGDDKLTIKARVLLHKEEGITKPVYIGEAKRILGQKENDNIEIEIFSDRLAEISTNSEIKS
jgi:hypothetical protein